jgi:hypothetical protein
MKIPISTNVGENMSMKMEIISVRSYNNYKSFKPFQYLQYEIMNENMILVLNFFKPHKLRKTLQVIIDQYAHQ